MTIPELLHSAVEANASDLFLSAGKKPSYRMKGQVIQADRPAVSAEEINAFRKENFLPEQNEIYRSSGACDVSYANGEDRFRINFYNTLTGPAMAVRPIRSGNSLNPEGLNLPKILEKLCESPRGLILLSGSTGSGKSTTLAAMINRINNTRKCHILTLEDPIEYVHEDRLSLISQREINTDAVGFSDALRSALRENPDVIVIGEMRDLETMKTAVDAALTGHLVISTVHTSNTIQAVERIINLFPETQRKQAAADLGQSLVALLSQRLIPAAAGKGMIPAMEILLGTPSVKKLIGDMDYRSIEDILRRNSGAGMMLFNRAIFKLYREGEITLEAARSAAENRDEFDLLVKGMESGVDAFRNQYGDGTEESSENVVDMRRLLRTALKNHASDLHLSLGARPNLRINGDLRPLDLPPLTAQDIQRLLFSIITQNQRVELEEKRELDFALSVSLDTDEDGNPRHISRFRINGFYQRGSLGVVARVVNMRIPSPAELNLPEQVVRLTAKQQGLILITGPTGSGKSTTLASLINLINRTQSRHIITIEDPIEYVHDDVNSVIEQRELHSDTLSFATALKYALRQDPDVIMVGEMRDIETISAALTAAETGHLVFATIHTNSAPQTIDRIVDSFPTAHQNQIRLQLGGVLLGVLSQRLLPRIDGNGRVAAFEVMIGTPPVQALVREGRTHQLQSVIETSSKDGMCTLEKSLEKLYEDGIVSLEQTKNYKADYLDTQAF